jgi:hypothetical protein
MALDFSLLVYLPGQDVFGRPVTVTAVESRGGAVYGARGILDTRGTMIQTDAGMAVMSDQETILDIRERDFGFDGNPPVQGDIIYVPPDNDITDMVGTYVVTDTSLNGGGEMTLILQKMDTPTLIKPPVRTLIVRKVLASSNSFKVPVVT